MNNDLTHLQEAATKQRLSIVVPLYNEEDNVPLLVEKTGAALAHYPLPWELILVDDGSTDQTARRLEELARHFPGQVRAVILQRNFGQTAAMQAGIDVATGTVIATMDGDLQNNPQDLPRMVDRLLNDDLDLLAGWRQNRQDPLLLRKVPSWIANRLIGRVTGVHLHDYGCSLKVFRASVIRQVRLYGEMHRFIPTWVAMLTSPARIREEPVSHFPRVHGTSKYGLSRTFKVILDLLAVYFFMRFRAKPGHFFGWFGLLSGFIGLGILAYLAFIKLAFGESIGARPLLMLGILLTVVGVQFLSTGILAELLTRTYYESSNSRPYIIRTLYGPARQDAQQAATGQPLSGEMTDRTPVAYRLRRVNDR